MTEHIYFCARALLFTIYYNFYNAGFSTKLMCVRRILLQTTHRHDALRTNPMMEHIYFCARAVLFTIYYNYYNAGFSTKLMYVGRTLLQTASMCNIATKTTKPHTDMMP